MGKVTESIWSDKFIVIPMADVQHIEKKCRSTGSLIGAFVITKHTIWNQDMDKWGNSIWLSPDQTEKFLSAWCLYRHELEKGKSLEMHGFDKDKTIVIKMQELIDRITSLEKDRSLEIHGEIGEAKDYEKQVKIQYVADVIRTNKLERGIEILDVTMKEIFKRMTNLENDLKTVKTTFEKVWDKIYESESNLKWCHKRIDDTIDDTKTTISGIRSALHRRDQELNEQIKGMAQDLRDQRIRDSVLQKNQDSLSARTDKIENEIKKIGILFLESIGSRDALNSRLDGLVDRILVLEKQTEGAEGDQIGKLWSRILKLENEKGEIGRLNVVFEHIGDLTKRVKELEEKK